MTTSEKFTEQRVKIYYDLYVPYEGGSRPLPLLIGLHGYEGNKESMMAMLNKVHSRDFIKASVQAPNAFLVRPGRDVPKFKVGFGWMMQYKSEETVRLHHETLRAVIEETAEAHPVDRSQIFLIGFSQSVSLNYRLAFTNPGLIRGVIAVCGGIPGDWDSDRYHRSDTDVLIIAGEEDEFYPAARSQSFTDALARRAGSVEYTSYPVGHVFPRESIPRINEWLAERVQS